VRAVGPYGPSLYWSWRWRSVAASARSGSPHVERSRRWVPDGDIPTGSGEPHHHQRAQKSDPANFQPLPSHIIRSGLPIARSCNWTRQYGRLARTGPVRAYRDCSEYRPREVQSTRPASPGVCQTQCRCGASSVPLNGRDELAARRIKSARWRSGAIQMRNNYDLEVFNGDTGTIVAQRPDVVEGGLWRRPSNHVWRRRPWSISTSRLAA